MDVYVTLTTVPFRCNTSFFINVVEQVCIKQTIKPTMVFINIPKTYLRFKEKIDFTYINKKLKHLPNVCINITDQDRGPCTKYIDTLENINLNLNKNLLIVLDDDRIYSEKIVEDYLKGIEKFNTETFNFCIGDHEKIKSPKYSFWCKNEQKWKIYNTYKTQYYMSKIKDHNKRPPHTGVCGFFGYAFYNFNVQPFIKYHNNIIKNIPLAIYHDDAIVSNYINFTENKSLYIDHISCERYTDIQEHSDCLFKSKIVDRLKINNDIYNYSSHYFKFNE